MTERQLVQSLVCILIHTIAFVKSFVVNPKAMVCIKKGFSPVNELNYVIHCSIFVQQRKTFFIRIHPSQQNDKSIINDLV